MPAQMGTVTEKRFVTSARRSTQRQRTTLWILGSGPAITRPSSSLICASLNLGLAPGGLRDAKPSKPALLVHPITKGLPVHTGLPRSIEPRCSLHDHGDCQKPPGLRRVIAPRRQNAKLRWQGIPAGDFDGCAHPILPCSESPPGMERTVLRVAWKSGESRVQGRLV